MPKHKRIGDLVEYIIEAIGYVNTIRFKDFVLLLAGIRYRIINSNTNNE